MSIANEIYSELEEMFPVVKSELQFKNAYELTIAVILSAQTTDVSVNKATKTLFMKYPDFETLAQATFEEVHECIRFLGLSKSKASHILALSQKLTEKHGGKIIPDFDFLSALPGIGRKSANVILSEGFGVPRIAVDAHVLRVANRLGFISSNDPLKVENRLMESYDPAIWHQVHLRLVFFGRYFCKARNPNCSKCPFFSFCTYENKKR